MVSFIQNRCVNCYLLKAGIILVLCLLLLPSISECAKNNKTNHVKWNRIITSPLEKVSKMWFNSIKKKQERQSIWSNINPEAYMTSVN